MTGLSGGRNYKQGNPHPLPLSPHTPAAISTPLLTPHVQSRVKGPYVMGCQVPLQAQVPTQKGEHMPHPPSHEVQRLGVVEVSSLREPPHCSCGVGGA